MPPWAGCRSVPRQAMLIGYRTSLHRTPIDVRMPGEDVFLCEMGGAGRAACQRAAGDCVVGFEGLARPREFASRASETIGTDMDLSLG